MNEVLEITNGWWKAAGHVFKWKQDGYHVFGVGIDRFWFKQPEIHVRVEGIEYALNSEEGKSFVKRYNSFKGFGDKKIAVVSRSLLKRVQEAPVMSRGQIEAKVQDEKKKDLDEALKNMGFEV